MPQQNMQHVTDFANELHDTIVRYADVVDLQLAAAVAYRFACMIACNAAPHLMIEFQNDLFLVTDNRLAITPEQRTQLDQVLMQINLQRNGSERP